jgi:hypothetical protein
MRDLNREGAAETPVARGHSARKIRRVKTAQREVMKLDVVESLMSELTSPPADGLKQIAAEAAEAIADHFLQLSQRTLVMVFGDHGFALEPAPGGGCTVRQGGASPEEVLVPGFAWLVGDVH